MDLGHALLRQGESRDASGKEAGRRTGRDGDRPIESMRAISVVLAVLIGVIGCETLSESGGSTSPVQGVGATGIEAATLSLGI